MSQSNAKNEEVRQEAKARLTWLKSFGYTYEELGTALDCSTPLLKALYQDGNRASGASILNKLRTLNTVESKGTVWTYPDIPPARTPKLVKYVNGHRCLVTGCTKSKTVEIIYNGAITHVCFEHHRLLNK
jgi:hypothetical protein